MPELILEASCHIRSAADIVYRPQVFGQQRTDGLWEGWIAFVPLQATQPALHTERETTQPDRGALAYWASGLEPIYYEGALVRARPAD